jgi:hypothetical protein
MKKHKVSKAKPKKFNFKMLLAGLALFLAVGGYALYRNSVEIPSINLADGVELEEAAYLSKTIKKSTPAAPAPQIKVTTKNTVGQEVTKTVSVARVQKAADDKSGKEMEELKNDIVETGIVVNKGNVVVKNETAVASQPPAGNQLGSTPAVTGTGTCSTNGSPVQVGTWVATGTYGSDDKGNSKPGEERCIQCVNEGGKTYNNDNRAFCKDVVARGELVVLPKHQQTQNINGVEIKMVSCYADVGGGSYVLVAPGQETSHKGKKGFCAPSGEIVDSLTNNKSFGDLCAARGLVEKNGKCEQKPANNDNQAVSGSDSKACSGEGMVLTADGKCVSEKFLNDQKASETKAKELALAAAKQSYPGKTECDKAIAGTSTLECYATGPIGSQTFAVRAKSASSVTLISCPMENKNLKNQMIDIKLGCGALSGAVAAIEARNIKNPNGKNLGGTSSLLSDCRYGGVPNDSETGYGTAYICYDYTKKLPLNTSTTVRSNPAAGTIFSNPKDSNELTARSDCEAAKTAGYECKSVGFNKYQLVLIPTVTSPLNSNAKPLSMQNGSGKTSGQVNDPNDCKYTPVATDPVSDKWVCPTEQTIAQFTPKSNERPEGQKSYVAPGNKLYNGGSCYSDNGACLSGYCESKVGFDKCANLPPTIQEKIEKLSSNIMENGGCVETFIEAGVRFKCESITSEPVFEFCDKGNGRFDSNGKCIPASGNKVAEAQGTAVGTGLTSAYLCALSWIPPFTPSGPFVCGAGLIASLYTGGRVIWYQNGQGQSDGETVPPVNPENTYSQSDLDALVKDTGPLTLQKGTLTDDPSKCENNGYDSSQNWGGSIKIGYHVYTCN